jgi:hypothetical protein
MPDSNEKQKLRIQQLRIAIQKCFPKPVNLHFLEVWAFANLGLSSRTFQKYVAVICELQGWHLDLEKMEIRPLAEPEAEPKEKS